MNSNSDSLNFADFSENTETSEAISIDEFFRQLEAKEKDLDISSEMIIEIEDENHSFDAPETKATAAPVAPAVEPEAAAPVVSQENAPSQIELFNLRNELSKLHIQLLRVESERAEMSEVVKRRQQEFENYKNRTERERTEKFRLQLSNLAVQILPVLDNMNRALDSTKVVSEAKAAEFQQFFDGIEMVSRQLNGVLAEMGVEPISALGEIFDPHHHEAVATEVTGAVASNTITAELQRGYRLGEHVIRPSMVKVSVSPTTGKLPAVPAVSGENLTTE